MPFAPVSRVRGAVNKYFKLKISYFLRSVNFKLLRRIKGSLIDNRGFAISVRDGHCDCSSLVLNEAASLATRGLIN